jgi:hypothetical protein
VFVIAAPVLAITTFSLGLVVTAILDWRRDRREVETMAGELQRQELEIAKPKHDLARLEGVDAPQAPKRESVNVLNRMKWYDRASSISKGVDICVFQQ